MSVKGHVKKHTEKKLLDKKTAVSQAVNIQLETSSPETDQIEVSKAMSSEDIRLSDSDKSTTETQIAKAAVSIPIPVSSSVAGSPPSSNDSDLSAQNKEMLNAADEQRQLAVNIGSPAIEARAEKTSGDPNGVIDASKATLSSSVSGAKKMGEAIRSSVQQDVSEDKAVTVADATKSIASKVTQQTAAARQAVPITKAVPEKTPELPARLPDKVDSSVAEAQYNNVEVAEKALNKAQVGIDNKDQAKISIWRRIGRILTDFSALTGAVITALAVFVVWFLVRTRRRQLPDKLNASQISDGVDIDEELTDGENLAAVVKVASDLETPGGITASLGAETADASGNKSGGDTTKTSVDPGLDDILNADNIDDLMTDKADDSASDVDDLSIGLEDLDDEVTDVLMSMVDGEAQALADETKADSDNVLSEDLLTLDESSDDLGGDLDDGETSTQTLADETKADSDDALEDLLTLDEPSDDLSGDLDDGETSTQALADETKADSDDVLSKDLLTLDELSDDLGGDLDDGETSTQTLADETKADSDDALEDLLTLDELSDDLSGDLDDGETSTQALTDEAKADSDDVLSEDLLTLDEPSDDLSGDLDDGETSTQALTDEAKADSDDVLSEDLLTLDELSDDLSGDLDDGEISTQALADETKADSDDVLSEDLLTFDESSDDLSGDLDAGETSTQALADETKADSDDVLSEDLLTFDESSDDLSGDLDDGEISTQALADETKADSDDVLSEDLLTLDELSDDLSGDLDAGETSTQALADETKADGDDVLSEDLLTLDDLFGDLDDGETLTEVFADDPASVLKTEMSAPQGRDDIFDNKPFTLDDEHAVNALVSLDELANATTQEFAASTDDTTATATSVADTEASAPETLSPVTANDDGLPPAEFAAEPIEPKNDNSLSIADDDFDEMVSRVQMKLDLAKAFISIDQKGRASALLGEIMGQGTPEQVEQINAILQLIDD